jgi:hypothetical protein
MNKIVRRSVFNKTVLRHHPLSQRIPILAIDRLHECERNNFRLILHAAILAHFR